MTLSSKFRKDVSILRAAANKEIFLDVKNPKLFKKVRRYYEREGLEFTGEPLEDYEILMEVLSEDLSHKQTANPTATNSEFDGYR
jgi:hypothetical protein|tara:strand:- start:363 stop:617 length:255 start_codon:yes stop_codon:yes gene_type:complete